MFEKQVVYLSQTMSGRPGLFTGRTMAVPLQPEEAASIDAARAVALRMGFEFDEATSRVCWAELARDSVQGMARVVRAMEEHTARNLSNLRTEALLIELRRRIDDTSDLDACHRELVEYVRDRLTEYLATTQAQPQHDGGAGLARAIETHMRACGGDETVHALICGGH